MLNDKVPKTDNNNIIGDIWNNQSQSISAEPKANADNTYRDLVGYHKNRI